MALNSELKKDIKKQLIEKIKSKIASYDFSKKSGNPFIDIIFGKYSNIKSFIHGMATTLGSDYEIIARKIANSNPAFVECKKFAFIGKISSSESAIIKNLAKDLEEKERESNYDEEIKLVYNADDKNIKETKITIDLYIKDKKGKEYFIEMKGPDPNKKEVRAAKEDLLNVVAMKKRDITLKDFHTKVAILFGIYYNNNEGNYENWKVSPLFESGKGLFVQEEFWDFLGGEGTFKELLGVITEVREEVKSLIENTIQSHV
jgi:hypothetical protein